MKLNKQEFELIKNYVRNNFGISLDNKQYLVESRIGSEIQRLGVSTFYEYWDKLNHDASGNIAMGLQDCITTHYTFFWREEKHFLYIAEEIAPKVDSTLNIWCAGCSTGQESYTLSMQLAECQRLGKLCHDYRITATDISYNSVETAQYGIYDSADCERLPAYWKNRYYLIQSDGRAVITTRIRDTIRYYRQNLMETRPGTNKFDIVFCRNVLIYFKDKERNIIVNNLVDSLKPGGYLFIGHTESLLGCDVTLDYIKPAIYRKPKEKVNAKK